MKFSDVDIEKAMLRSCKDAKGKENRFVSHLCDNSHLWWDSIRADGTGAPEEGSTWSNLFDSAELGISLYLYQRRCHWQQHPWTAFMYMIESHTL